MAAKIVEIDTSLGKVSLDENGTRKTYRLRGDGSVLLYFSYKRRGADRSTQVERELTAASPRAQMVARLLAEARS